MNIVIDIGNSFIKAAIFNHGNIVWKKKTTPELLLDELKSIKKEYPDTLYLLYSASGSIHENFKTFFRNNFVVIPFNHKTKTPFINLYQTPETLGLDRIALVSAAHYTYPQKNVLIIDAGTCITYDFITKKGHYVGGNISPGLDMRFKALNHYTAGLPRLKFQEPVTFPLGKNTNDAILNGVIKGISYEIDEYINRYTSDYKDLTIILTGGDQQYLSRQLKNTIFADSNFQLIGLNVLLEFLLND